MRGLRRGPLRFALSLASVGTALALVLLFEGFRAGLYEQLRQFPEQLPVDLIVTQRGVENMAGARSTLPQVARAQVEAVHGVVSAHPMTGIPLIYTADNGDTSPIMVVAYDGVGGPNKLVAGRRPSAERELVIDRSLAAKFDLSVGDVVDVLGSEFELVGVADGAAAMFTPFVFARYDDLVLAYVEGAFEDAGFDPPILGYLLVELQPTADVAVMQARIRKEVAGIDVWTPAQVAAADLRMGRRMMDPVMGVLVGVAYAMAVLIIGLTTYASVLDRRREYAIMKAMGARTVRLAAQLVLESILLCTLGLGLAAVAAAVAAIAVESVAPEFIVLPLEPEVMARSGAGALLVALFGIIAPIWRIGRVDPALAFRS